MAASSASPLSVPSALRRVAKGTLREPGMRPERRPWRGSGAVPSKRAAARASTICAALLAIRPLTSPTSRTSSALSMAVKWRSPRRRGLPVLEGTAFRLPFLEAAVQDAHLLVAHGAEHPPHARRRVEALAVVGDDVHAVADAHLLHAAGELLRRRQHVRQGRLVVGDVVDVEEQRARNVLGQVFGLGVALGGRQVHRAVEDDEARGVEVGGQPLRLHQPSVSAIGHAFQLPGCLLLLVVAVGLTRRRRGCAG